MIYWCLVGFLSLFILYFLGGLFMPNKNILSVLKNINGLLKNDQIKNNLELMNAVMKSVCDATGSIGAALVKKSGKLSGSVNLAANLKFNDCDSADSGSDENWSMDKNIHDQMSGVQDCKVNFKLDGFGKYNSAVVPINDDLLFMYKDGEYSDSDIDQATVYASAAAMVNKQNAFKQSESEKQLLRIAHDVLDSLSFTEIDVISEVLDCLQNGEGLVVASKIADRNGYARSVTVNALRKLESAGVIKTRSLGVKGTYIYVLNRKLCTEIKKFQRKGKKAANQSN